jgi:hypothetical protein
MVFSTLYQFGLKSGVGAESLAQYFEMIRIDKHVGVSASVLRRQLKDMEVLLRQYQMACESSLYKQTRKIVAGLDETFSGFGCESGADVFHAQQMEPQRPCVYLTPIFRTCFHGRLAKWENCRYFEKVVNV